MKTPSSGKTFFILSILATDRVGIVDEVAKFLFDRDCSIEDSRMAVLGGEFAMALLANGTIESASRVEADLKQLESAGNLMVQYRVTRAPEDRAPQNTLPYRIRVTSLDHPGIVFKISRLLRERGINIENANTETLSAPFGGSPIFHLEMEVHIPAILSLAQLRKVMTELSEQENMDIEIQSIPG